MSSDKSVEVAVELDDATVLELNRVAEVDGIGNTDVIQRAIRFYLDHGESYRRFLTEGAQSWEHYKRTGLHVTGEEVDAWLMDLEAGQFDAEPPKCHT